MIGIEDQGAIERRSGRVQRAQSLRRPPIAIGRVRRARIELDGDLEHARRFRPTIQFQQAEPCRRHQARIARFELQSEPEFDDRLFEAGVLLEVQRHQVMHHRQHQDQIKLAGHAVQQGMCFRVFPSIRRRRPRKIGNHRQHIGVRRFRALPDAVGGRGIALQRQHLRVVLGGQQGVSSRIGADVENGSRRGVAQRFINKRALLLNLRRGVMLCRHFIL